MIHWLELATRRRPLLNAKAVDNFERPEAVKAESPMWKVEYPAIVMGALTSTAVPAPHTEMEELVMAQRLPS